MTDRPAILLFDGTCAFCARSVRFVLRHEGPRHTLRFASLQSAFGSDIQQRHPESNGADSVIWFEPSGSGREEVLVVRSAAVLHVLRYLGGIWRLIALIGALIPSPIRDRVYDLVARHRHRLSRGEPACLMPSESERERFIERATELGN